MRSRLRSLVVLLVLGLVVGWVWSRGRRGLSADADALIQEAVEQAIAEKKLPGAVVLVGHRGRVIYRRAFGRRSVEPDIEPMTVDTIFDLSSLTKTVATATSIMILLERGKLRLNDPLVRFVPEMRDSRARRVTVQQLLTHTSGFPTQLDLHRSWSGREGALKELTQQTCSPPPGTQFRYSDVNYIALGFVVETLTDQTLASFSRDNIFAPLGIEKTTLFCPPPELVPSIAPTEWRGNRMLRGAVHGAQTERMGGIAGHGGLFSRADDLARYCQMILDGGSWGGKSILSPLTVARMTAPTVVSAEGSTRGLGWDIESTIAMSRGEFFPLGSFGHTGYAGVSLWIDPSSQTYVILMSNMVHPDGTGDVKSLRARIFSIVASHLEDVDVSAWNSSEAQYSARVATELLAFRNSLAEQGVAAREAFPDPVLSGLDVLRQRDFADLRGGRFGLLTNLPSTRAELQGRTTLLKLPPDPTGWAGLTGLVIDLQATGSNRDPSLAWLRQALQEAEKRKLRVVVLDRPNPLGGLAVEGPLPDPRWSATFPVPTRHGLTTAELARLMVQEDHRQLEVRVVAMENWRRSRFYEDCGLVWQPPQPGLPDLDAVLLDPILGPLGERGLSLAQGTPWEGHWFGAGWLDSDSLSRALNAEQLPGIRFVSGPLELEGKTVPGCHLVVVDRQQLQPIRVSLALGSVLRRLHPKRWRWKLWAASLGDPATAQAIEKNVPLPELVQSWEQGVVQFAARRDSCLLYP